MSIDQERWVDGLPATDAFAAPGEPWLTLATLEEARLRLRIRDVTVRWALAGIRHRACANTWGMDVEAAEWAWKADVLGRELADLEAQLVAVCASTGHRPDQRQSV
ncbi:hypothetical protein [Pengzhenrongella sp.]|jgi:hypothetical protein|uniref:hypothetical protein n=1 Tax=Pengzhenrongella sp. TaxID=2888820 RepID=UPI002F95D783